MSAILQTDPSYALVVLRLGLAVIFFAHGAQHVFGWFGGRGPADTIENWNKKRGIPVPVCILTLFIEVGGGVLSMICGFLVRPAALGLAVFMFMAMKEAHWQNGFFLSQGPGKENGIEFCLALFIMSITLLVGGAGALSIDRLLSR
jgi:putative oxidoreductase